MTALLMGAMPETDDLGAAAMPEIDDLGAAAMPETDDLGTGAIPEIDDLGALILGKLPELGAPVWPAGFWMAGIFERVGRTLLRGFNPFPVSVFTVGATASRDWNEVRG